MKFVADENFDNRILRGRLRLQPDLDIVRVQDLDISGGDDLTILAWAADEDRILLTHDQRTVPFYSFQMMQGGKQVAGVIIAGSGLALGKVMEEILIIIECSSAPEWINQVQRLPL